MDIDGCVEVMSAQNCNQVAQEAIQVETPRHASCTNLRLRHRLDRVLLEQLLQTRRNQRRACLGVREPLGEVADNLGRLGHQRLALGGGGGGGLARQFLGGEAVDLGLLGGGQRSVGGGFL